MAPYWIPGQQLLATIFFLSIVGLSVGTKSEIEVQGVVCYETYGCFTPFKTDPDAPLPMSPEQINVKFLLYTASYSTSANNINASRYSLENSVFDASKSTKIIVHGWLPSSPAVPVWASEMKNALLANEDVNVIVVDWVDGSAIAYDQAVGNTRLVGAMVAHLIRTIMDVHEYDPTDFHVIGFSLGAHVAGFAGKELIKHDSTHKLARITGLDPANPKFNFDSAVVRLDKTDALFVDVIHTDTKSLLVASGLDRDIGHSDYYPNGGSYQPGCDSAYSDMSCGHERAPMLFTNSINATEDCDFAGYRCSSYVRFKAGLCARCKGRKSKKGSKTRCNKMGYWAQPPNTKKHAKYYLQTSNSKPFCAKHYQVQLHWRKGPGSSSHGFRGSIFVTLHGEKGSTKEYALNDGVTFHIVPGKTSRFLISYDCANDIGIIDRVTFRWERPTCWTYYFCTKENVYLKRVKVNDLLLQKRSIFLPLEMDKNGDGRKDVFAVPANVKQEVFRKTYIRSRHPHSLIGRAKTQLTLVPDMVPVSKNNAHKTNHGRFAQHISDQGSKLY